VRNRVRPLFAGRRQTAWWKAPAAKFHTQREEAQMEEDEEERKVRPFTLLPPASSSGG